MEYKLLTSDFKVSTDGNGGLKGYASTFSNWDTVKERPVKGAFAPHLNDFLKDGFIAIGHDWQALPVATPSIAQEDDIGLYLEADFHSTPMAQDARTVATERLARGKSVKLSIGYEVLQDEYVEEGRLLKEIKLYEVSLVTVPANPLASVTGAKADLGIGLPMVEHSERVVSAVKEFIRRVKDRQEFRTKEGRVLSSAIRQQLKELDDQLGAVDQVRQAIRDLLATTNPDTEKSLQRELLRLRSTSHHLRQKARELGVSL